MPQLTRLPDWPERLSEIIDAARYKPFVWGEHDCCLFAMDCVQAMTGVDLAAPYRGYKGKKQGLMVLKENGGLRGIAETVARKFNIAEIDPAFAGRGDVCLFNIGQGDSLGIRAGEWIYAPGLDAIAAMRLSLAKRAWRI